MDYYFKAILINLLNMEKIKFYEKIVQIKRVTKVVKGGKKMAFQALVIVGDKKRKVGLGIGRANDANKAIEKAIYAGKKNLIIIPLTIFFSIPHIVTSSYGASKLLLKPASVGTGVIAGGSVRPVLEFAGLKNIVAKQFGSKNNLNNVKATLLALKKLKNIIEIGKKQSSLKSKFYKELII